MQTPRWNQRSKHHDHRNQGHDDENTAVGNLKLSGSSVQMVLNKPRMTAMTIPTSVPLSMATASTHSVRYRYTHSLATHAKRAQHALLPAGLGYFAIHAERQ